MNQIRTLLSVFIGARSVAKFSSHRSDSLFEIH